jgi:hypothetical protein
MARPTVPEAGPQPVEGNPEDDPMLGDEGYPTEQELQRIRAWPMDDFRALMAYIKPRWEHYGSFDQRGDRFRLATGGWSGNESIIDALEGNWMFQTLCPESWRTGGLYIYDVQQWDDNPEEGKRLRLRDAATPLDEWGSVFACDHFEEPSR